MLSNQKKNSREIGTSIHYKNKFSNQEWADIKEILELNNQYGIALRKLKGEISFKHGETRKGLEIWAKGLEKKLLINNIRKNADKWEIRKEIVELDFNEGEVLARKTAKINREEDYNLIIGGLINKSNEFYGKDYFDDKEQEEINSILTAYKVIEKINQDKGKDNWMIITVKPNPNDESENYVAVINKSAIIEVDGERKLDINGEYYKREQFHDKEWDEINRVLKRIKLINYIKQNINEFEFQTVLVFRGQYRDNVYDKEKRETMLVHESVKITESDYDERGYLNINNDKMFQENQFNQEEWTEIRSALKVSDIKRNAKLERGLCVINRETGEVSENEDWFIHNQLKKEFDNKTGYLIYVPNAMIRAKDLSEAEQIEVGYNNKSEASLQNIPSVSEVPKDNKLGTGGILAIIGVISAVVIAGVFLVRKKLNSRSKVNKSL